MVYPQPSRLGMGVPHIESAWVTYPDGCYMVGQGAKKFHGSEVRDDDLKADKALFKILAILSYVQRLEAADGPIQVAVLLPFDEYASKKDLEAKLRYLSDVTDYCGQSQKLNIEQIQICPEGAGLFLSGLPTSLDPAKVRIGVLVVGHRNISWLVTEKGGPVLEESVTNNLGFRWVVQEVRSRTGYKDEMSLAEMIFSDRELAPKIKEAVDEVLPLYWQQIQSFLQEQRSTDYVVCGGGAALLLKDEITGYLPGKVSWANHLSREVARSGIRDPVLIRRLTDCYGLLLSMGG